jgi:hypothetical protein
MNDVPWTLISSFAGAMGGCATLTWWLSSKFGNIYERINKTERSLSVEIISAKERVLGELDAHERLDQARFESHKETIEGQKLAIMKIEMALQAGGLNPLSMPHRP